jgi:hypothetical protein
MHSTKVTAPFDVAKLLNLEIPEACRPGIEANLVLLHYHANILDDYLARLSTAALAPTEASDKWK